MKLFELLKHCFLQNPRIFTSQLIGLKMNKTMKKSFSLSFDQRNRFFRNNVNLIFYEQLTNRVNGLKILKIEKWFDGTVIKDDIDGEIYRRYTKV